MLERSNNYVTFTKRTLATKIRTFYLKVLDLNSPNIAVQKW